MQLLLLILPFKRKKRSRQAYLVLFTSQTEQTHLDPLTAQNTLGMF